VRRFTRSAGRRRSYPLSEAEDDEALGSNVIRGALWTFLGRILPQSYLLISSVVAARVLGASGLGQLTFITFTAATVGTLLTLGFPAAVSRHVAESIGAGHADEIASLQRWAWRFGWPVALVAAGALWLAALLGAEPRAAWFLAGIYSGCLVLHQIPSNLLMGARRWRDAMIIGTSTGLVSTIVRVVVLISGWGVVGVIAVDAAVGVANVVFTSALARRALREVCPSPKDAPALIRRAIRYGTVASISVVITWVVFRRSEVFFLQYYSSSDQVAIYSIPFTMVETLLFLPRSITFVLGPTFAMLYGAGELVRLREGYGRSLRLVTTFAIVATVYSALVGPAFVSLLYGAAFQESGVVLRILLLTYPIVPLMTLSTALLNAMGRQWFATAVVATATVVNLTLDVVLIQTSGATGAAVANGCAQVIATLPMVFYARRIVGGTELGGFVLVRCVVVSLTAAAVALPALEAFPALLGIVVSSLVFALVFLVLARYVPIITSTDAGALDERVGTRAGGIPRAILLRVSGRSVAARPPRTPRNAS
jgi:O-antigen/teichoic acid export membrane protein